MRQREPGILSHGTLEERARALERLARPVVQEIPSAQVKLIRIGVDRVALAQPLAFGAAQPDAQGGGQFFRDLRLEDERIGDGATEDRSPELRTVLDIDELGANDEGATSFEDAPDEHRLDAEVAPDRSRIDVLALVTEDSAARHHAQARNL